MMFYEYKDAKCIKKIVRQIFEKLFLNIEKKMR